jgi:hypothetical protein
MSPKQQKDIRLRVLRLLLHPASSLAEVLEGVPYRDLMECLDIVTDTLTARLELLERAYKHKGIVE